jgi:hypothetical protein
VSFLADVLVVMMVAVALMVAGAATAFVLVRRRARRQWRRLQAQVSSRGGRALVSAFMTWRDRVGEGSSFGGAAGRARPRMWSAIEDAEAAVEHASSRNAPVAELPSVCRSLRRVGGELDQLLAMEQRIPRHHLRSAAARAQAAEVVQAAADVQSAALRACSDATELQVRSLVRQAGDEVEIVSAALTRLRSLSSP